jgi:NRPS condensation-like uncharacterized protein
MEIKIKSDDGKFWFDDSIFKFGDSKFKFKDSKFKLGENKIKFGDSKSKRSDIKIKLDESGYKFMDMYADSLSRFYDKLPHYMSGYFREMNKLFEKYAEPERGDTGTIPDSPDVFPANGHDIFNYIARFGMGNYNIQAVLTMDGRLDYEKLSRAVRMTIDAEPVLGCRFVEATPPYWKRMEDIDRVLFCLYEETADGERAVKAFLDRPLDMDNDPKIKVKLIRTGDKDHVVIKANHACFDGAGIKEYISLLQKIYNVIEEHECIFIPRSGRRGRTDQDRLFENLGINDTEALWIPGSDITIPTWSFPWKKGQSDRTRILLRRFPEEQLKKMSEYSKSKGATINDLFVTAYFRAMLGMGRPVYGVPMGVSITVDLRRYLPDGKTQALRNFSGATNIWLNMIENETFEDTLHRVVYMMKEIKRGYPGLQSAIGLERLEKISFRDTLSYYQATTKFGKSMRQCPSYTGDRCIPTLSNVGVVSKELIKFGNITVTDAIIIPPVVSAPGMLLEVGTYNGVLSMALGFYEDSVLSEDVDRLLDGVYNQLVSNCVPESSEKAGSEETGSVEAGNAAESDETGDCEAKGCEIEC